MSETKRPLKVFLCHASADKPAVLDLYKRLVADGVDAWLDAESLIAGQKWEVEIPKAIRDSDVVIVCLSEKSINKEGYVQREIKFALDIADEKPEGMIFIIPAKLEECKVPDRLSTYHWVELIEEEGYRRLMRALRMRADKIDVTLQVPNSWLQSHLEEPAQKIALDSKLLQTQVREFVRLINSRFLKKISPRIIIAILASLTFVIVAALKPEFFSQPPIFSTPSATTIIPPSLTFNHTLPAKTFTPSKTPTKTATLEVMQTFTPSITITQKSASATLSFPVEITDAKGVQMVYVPSGSFTMGYGGVVNQGPTRKVFLSSFYIDKYEVSEKMYAQCVQDEACEIPNAGVWRTIDQYIDAKVNDNFPVVHVNWEMAGKYCEWREARLPTEAEWEKAARGSGNSLFPWGSVYNGNVANLCDKNCESVSSNSDFNDGYGWLAPVDAFSRGASSYGVYNMVGNVNEWVGDLYSTYYIRDQLTNPKGPTATTSNSHVIRGGAYNSDEWPLPVSISRWLSSNGGKDIGFRCAYDLKSDDSSNDDLP